ncbi:PREDICTED: membrane protein of ER body-like protein [Brassica oleracea var. oleracea]|uniref:membrane protein of ER body-like protein n=1 Tax=Brassica oleracea var. oleracea TaxID=109376 RepID=UPI0006A6D120|nr:PREDICTED: membrane protein of ER body-like protein [Brassica oleracea var. oleracea]
MAFAEVMELTTGTEKHHQDVAMEEDDQVFGLERKTSSLAHEKGPDSANSSTITTTNTSSSSSFSGDGERVTLESLEVYESAEKEIGFYGEHEDLNNGNVYLDVDQGSESSDDHESQTVDHLNGEKKVTEFEKGSYSEDKKGSRDQIDEVQDGDIPEEVEVIEEEEVDIEDVKDYKAKELLENQKTPDLLCPKCKNCITKVVVLKKRVLLKKKVAPKKRKEKISNVADSVPATGHIGTSGILRSQDNPPSSGDGNSAIPELEQSFIYKCLSCFSTFKRTGVEGGLSIQPKPLQEAPGDFNCLRGVFGFNKEKEPDVHQESKLYDPSEGLNDGAPVEHKNNSTGEGRLTPIPKSSERPDTRTPDIGQTNVTGVVDTEPRHRIDIPPLSDNPIDEETLEERLLPQVVEGRKPEILKSIVYGGLTEAITSLGVISSAAGSGASTLNILVLGLANLFSGLILIINNLHELKKEEPIRETTQDSQTNGEEESQYKRLLGRREHFMLHATIAILSFIITGLLPPVVYYFSFRETHNKDYKVASVFGASLICITFLALAKAHVSNPRGNHLKSVLYYATTAVSVSGITYVVGNVVNQLLEKYGWSDGSETPVGEMMLSLMGRKAGGFGYSSSY